MNYLRLIPASALVLMMTISACSNSQSAPDIDAGALPTIDLVATSQVVLPDIAEKITFAPNSVAPWTGHIIVQSKDGSLYRTTAMGDKPVTLGVSNSKDIFGLYRENAAGAFLSIDEACLLYTSDAADD